MINVLMQTFHPLFPLQLSRLVASTRKLEDQVERCIWFQQLLLALTMLSLTFMVSLFYLLYS